jgi:tetratricopeptide (TPR) repeat protein
MKKSVFSAALVAIVALLLVTLFTPASLRAQTTDPAKIAALQAKFKSGVELFNEGKNDEALKVFNDILSEEPKAPGSLFFSAFINLHKFKYEEAAALSDRFLEVQPKDFKGYVLAIQANQALKRTARVETLRKTLFTLRDTISPIPGLVDTRTMYIRERIQGGDGRNVIVAEYFDYKVEPYVVYMAEQVGTDGKPVRRLVLSYDSQSRETEKFALCEYVIVNGEIKQINIYRQENSRPDYLTCRQWMLDAIKNPPKPLFSTSVNGTMNAGSAPQE